MDLEAIATAVKRQTALKGWNQADLQEAAGVSHDTVSKVWNARKEFMPAIYVQLSEALWGRGDYLFLVGDGRTSELDDGRLAALERDVRDLRQSVARLQETLQQELKRRQEGRGSDGSGPPASP